MTRRPRRSRSLCALVPALLLACACSSGPAEPAAPIAPTAVAPAPASVDAAVPAGPATDARTRDFSEKHMVFDDDWDAGPIPIDHTDSRWGDFIGRDGKPAVGWHSHDRDAGNAR